ncbi:MAG TPA: hypothetical protein GXX35_01330 [Thermoanaerobacterales bacterium]|nr:hypothetical protein [Thermoanaerobacterales bacterium]
MVYKACLIACIVFITGAIISIFIAFIIKGLFAGMSLFDRYETGTSSIANNRSDLPHAASLR